MALFYTVIYIIIGTTSVGVDVFGNY